MCEVVKRKSIATLKFSVTCDSMSEEQFNFKEKFLKFEICKNFHYEIATLFVCIRK